jgi:hypothetical protein
MAGNLVASSVCWKAATLELLSASELVISLVAQSVAQLVGEWVHSYEHGSEKKRVAWSETMWAVHWGGLMGTP